MKPTVSVIIPTYNRLEYIGEAVKSVLAQTYQNYEIIVIDDGSLIDVKKALSPFKNKIKYIRQKHKGLGTARNTGAKVARGKYLAFLDDDDLFEPKKLEVQVKILENKPQIGFVYSGSYYFEQGGGEMHLAIPKERNFPEKEFTRIYFSSHDIPISALLVRRSSFKKIGFWDEDSGLFSNEDVDMWVRLSLQFPGVFSAYPSTKIRLHPGRMSQDRILIYKNLVYCLKRLLRNYPELRKKLGKDAQIKIIKIYYLLGQELLRKGLRQFKNIFRRKTIREINFISGTTTWRECLLVLWTIFWGRGVVNGKQIKEYEERFREYLGVKYSFSFGTGRMAFYSILKAMGIKKGDEVILPGYTCVVVPNAVIYCGGKPVYIDIDRKTLNIDASKIEKKITPRTKVIYAQHTFGSFCDMSFITKIAKKHNLQVVEDCSQAFGAEYAGRKLGTFGNAAYFTTEQSKIISTGMGGMAVTNNKELAVKIKQIQDQADFYEEKVVKKIALQIVLYWIFYHPLIYFFGKYILGALRQKKFFLESTTKEEIDGKRPKEYPVRLSNIQAKIGLSQLENIDNNLNHRHKIARRYRDLLTRLNYEIPENNDKFFNPSYVRYWFLTERKEEFKEQFRGRGIELGEWFNSPLHPKKDNLEALFYERGSCPVAEYITEHNLNLPTHPKINQGDIDRIGAVMNELVLPRK